MVAEVGVAFLSASLQVLFDRLASPAVIDFIKGKKLNPELVQRLKTTLYAVGAVLNDAENKQIKDRNVENWLDDLKVAVYVADDLLDTLSTRAATQSQEEVSSFFSFLNLQGRDNMANEIAAIIERLEQISKQKDILGLTKVGEERSSWRPPSTCLPDVYVYGRDKDREAIINLLLSDDRGHSNIGVIAIVGMGGIGKTTLAQSVYNDEIVRRNFDLLAWVCVSEEFDVFNIIKTIMETIAPGHRQIKDFNLLQLDLKEKLKEKKFLIVLDDVWKESCTAWDPLMTPFYHGSEGSKLIVTTRSEKVASIIQTVPFYHLGLLSDEDCWSVFKNHASPLRNPTVDSFLEKNHGDIINKCKGLPLAAKLLGSLLRSKPDVRKWDMVLQNNIWDLSESETEIIPALRVSYYYLPPHLKRCFVHCSLFPKDYEFKRDELILLWMAEDLVRPRRDGNMTLKEVADDYFDELMSRSFFQSSKNQTPGRFVMHDLIHDLATYFAGKFYGISKIDEEKNVSEDIRHMSYNMMINFPSVKRSEIETLGRAKTLRTFLPLTSWWISRGVSSENAPLMLQTLFNLKCMRVLSLCGFDMVQILPESICELIHLRYLDLSCTAIKMLPGSVCKLHNLQTLKLKECPYLTILPNNIYDLVNLRFLDVRNTPLEEMPRGLGKCKNLHYLSDFIISKDQGARIEELGDLPNIGDSLRIGNLQYVSNGEEASLAKILDKKHVESLELVWASNDHMLDSVTERDILDKLQPHSNLRIFSIVGYGGTRWPDWFGLQDMTTIYLADCKNCYSLPPLGQLPSLKSLWIEGFAKMMRIETEFYTGNISVFATPFPSLTSWVFWSMPEWHEWCLFEMGAFPRLQEFRLYDCPKLVGYLPKNLPALKYLQINKCQQLASCIPKAELFDEITIHESEVVFQAEEGAISVKGLNIAESKNLSSFPIDGFPNVERLSISCCENLESIVVSQNALQSIIGEYNPNLLSSSGGLPVLNMIRLRVWECPNLKSLPHFMDRLLPKLKELDIRGCPEIEWPGEGDMPPHLTHLTIDLSVFSKFSNKWGLLSIAYLAIVGEYDDNGSVQCFPEQGLLLPSSLNSLYLYDIQTLTTLDCEGFLHLTCLQDLLILSCPKLEKIAGQKLPSSVNRLRIIECPLLEEQCRTKNAEIWPKISHVPAIKYDWS